MERALIKVPLFLFFFSFFFFLGGGGGGGRHWSSRLNFTSISKFTQFWGCPRNNPSPLKARTTKLWPDVQNTLVKVSIVLPDLCCYVQFNLISKYFLYPSLLRFGNICETCKTEFVELFRMPHGSANMLIPLCTPKGSKGTVNPSRVVRSSGRRLRLALD